MVPMFEISHALEGHACVARLSGDIDTAIVPELRDELDHSIEAGCANVVLDLTHVTYADSSALGLLVWLDHKLRPCGGRVLLAGANQDVSRILELSGLASLTTSIAVTEDVASALAGLDTEVVQTAPLWSEDICNPRRHRSARPGARRGESCLSRRSASPSRLSSTSRWRSVRRSRMRCATALRTQVGESAST